MIWERYFFALTEDVLRKSTAVTLSNRTRHLIQSSDITKAERTPMGRLPDINEATLSSEQRRVYDEINRVRGQVRGPFAVWLRNPELAECTLKLQALFASRSKLDGRLVQLIVLVCARLA